MNLDSSTNDASSPSAAGSTAPPRGALAAGLRRPRRVAAPKRTTRARSLLALIALTLVAAGCGAVHHMSATAGNPTLGKKYFMSVNGTNPSCADCHTLAAAGASGTIGPNLDYAFGPDRCQGFKVSTIRDVVRGQIAYADQNPNVDWPPNSTDAVQGMPANLVSGQRAKDIAAYVASVAGLTHGPGQHWDCTTGAYALAST